MAICRARLFGRTDAPDSEICTVDYETGRIISIGGRPWPERKRRMTFPRLVESPGKIAKRYTFMALGCIATLQGAWQAVPAVEAAIPPEWAQGITLGLAVLGALGAFIDQPKAR